MRIWPIILDSQPSYLGSRGRSGSLLLSPLGTHTLIEHIADWVRPITGRAPLVVSRDSDPEYRRWIATLCPSANVAVTPSEVVDAVAALEMSDTFLIIDSRALPAVPTEFSSLLHQYSRDSRIAHHLVAFENAVAGTQERVRFDRSGRVRGILRHYDAATWPFIGGVTATLAPVASGIFSDGVIPASLEDVRQHLVGRGVPTRDIPLEGGALDLRHEAGLLAANELFVRNASRTGSAGGPTPVCMGSGHSIHSTARISGPVVIHAEAEIGENAIVVGPAVIGAGARVSAGAIVAHSAIGPDCTVPTGEVVRNRAWFAHSSQPPAATAAPLTYRDRIAGHMAHANGQARPPQLSKRGRESVHLFKRWLDIAASAFALALLSPILAIAAIAVWIDSKGPIFYGDEREGLGGRVFRCWKFRTMCVGAHAAQSNLKALDKMDGPHFKLDHDPRVTRVGRVLRALNLDELPQLFNVLTGEMSLVGPRPSPFRENQICVPWREARLSVRPGITGFWQVCRHDRSLGDFHQWIEYDLLYVQHISVWLDLKILCATVMTLGGKAGYVPAQWLVSSAGAPPRETSSDITKDSVASAERVASF